jgi:hypothetical protein
VVSGRDNARCFGYVGGESLVTARGACLEFRGATGSDALAALSGVCVSAVAVAPDV